MGWKPQDFKQNCPHKGWVCDEWVLVFDVGDGAGGRDGNETGEFLVVSVEVKELGRSFVLYEE